MRLNKYLAQAGIASRRAGDELILAGRVSVNGVTVAEPGQRVDPQNDTVTLDGKAVAVEEKSVYYMLHKPAGFLTTVSDPFGRPTVMELLRGIKERIYPVGRLDYDSEGLLLFTNDGALSYGLTHPGREVEKEYRVLLADLPDRPALRRLETGLFLDGRKTAPARVEVVRNGSRDIWIHIVIHEGRKRQVRLMFEQIGHQVKRLQRIRVGDLRLENLPSGVWRPLRSEEVEALKRLAAVHDYHH
jgi:pseudouridine synthase